jgi:hypothetical protein
MVTPTPRAAKYVLNGGNPTDHHDPVEVHEYPDGTDARVQLARAGVRLRQKHLAQRRDRVQVELVRRGVARGGCSSPATAAAMT